MQIKNYLKKGDMKEDNISNISDIKLIVSNLGSKYGADKIYLFGSYARGDADCESDIDLRIDKGSIRGYPGFEEIL